MYERNCGFGVARKYVNVNVSNKKPSRPPVLMVGVKHLAVIYCFDGWCRTVVPRTWSQVTTH